MNRRQYMVIAAGGHSKVDTKRGDSIVAFALREAVARFGCHIAGIDLSGERD